MSALSTQYLGLDLPHPLVPSSSPLSRTLDSAKRLEDAGAAALVLFSLFEEDIHDSDTAFAPQEHGNFEATDFLPNFSSVNSEADNYVEHLHQLKSSMDIPVIASLNGVSLDGWIDYSRQLQQAGADAIELNVYYIAADFSKDAAEVETQYLELIKALRQDVSIPICVKLSPYFSSLGHFVSRLQEAGADGVALFNRFYHPDFDVDTLRVANTIHLSSSNDSLLTMHWIAMLRHQIGMTLAATGGVHKAEDAVKMILAGADVIYLCSTLLLKGPGQIGHLLKGIEQWLEESPYETLEQARGALAMHYRGDPIQHERNEYKGLISGYSLNN